MEVFIHTLIDFLCLSVWDKMEQWKITLHAETQTYWIQNVGTKRWLSTQDDSQLDTYPFTFTGVDNDIGPVHWDLRQGEWDGEF